MPRQRNFRNQVINRPESRFLASRLVRVPNDEILLQELPASFGYDEQDNIELHFYTARTNVLITSIVTKISEQIVKLHIVGYDDNSYKTYLQIDFTKLLTDKNTTIIPGDYLLTINLFSDEIGSYENRILSIAEISPSRTEVELVINNSTDDVTRAQNDTLLAEFVSDSFTKADAIGVMEKVLKTGVQTGDTSEGINGENVIAEIPIEFSPRNRAATVDRLDRLGLTEPLRLALDAYIPKLFEKIREQIVIGDERVQVDELAELLNNELAATIEELRVTVDPRINLI